MYRQEVWEWTTFIHLLSSIAYQWHRRYHVMNPMYEEQKITGVAKYSPFGSQGIYLSSILKVRSLFDDTKGDNCHWNHQR